MIRKHFWLEQSALTPCAGWPSMRDCFNRMEDSSNYISASVLQTNVDKNTSSVTGRDTESQMLYVSRQSCTYSTLWCPLYPLFSYCSTLCRLDMMSQCCNNLSYIFIHLISTVKHLKQINGSTNSRTNTQCCLPLRHYCRMLLVVLLAFDPPFSDYLVKWLTHLLVKPTQ